MFFNASHRREVWRAWGYYGFGGVFKHIVEVKAKGNPNDEAYSERHYADPNV